MPLGKVSYRRMGGSILYHTLRASKMLGLFGVKEEIEMESNRILLKHGISTEAYSPAALNCLLPHDVKWKIPQASCITGYVIVHYP